MMNGYYMLDGVQDKPPHIRAAAYLGSSGMALLMLSAFAAASTWVCKEECVHIGDSREDSLLKCVDHCEVQGKASKDKTCESQCHSQVGFTRRQVRDAQRGCEQDCSKHPGFMRFSAFLGTAAVLTVVPILSTYKDACRCECCIGLGCSSRLALFNIGWVAYGFSCLWVLPSVLEEPAEVGGKVLFGLAQGIAMSAMAASRRLAEQAQARGPSVGEPTWVAGAPSGHSHPMSVIGASANGPSNQELQAQIQQLQQQVRDLVKLQTLQIQTAVAPAQTSQPDSAPPSNAQPPQQLL
mmetsp:Transcript_25979/g.35061  ORF Transcript_25979/g.35061 Transcript_25979/m.35061 type:complete len:295 (-) Transcript_25979:161-1045(-)